MAGSSRMYSSRDTTAKVAHSLESCHQEHALLAPAAAMQPVGGHGLVPPRLWCPQRLVQWLGEHGRGGGDHPHRLPSNLVQQLPHCGQLLNVKPSQHENLGQRWRQQQRTR